MASPARVRTGSRIASALLCANELSAALATEAALYTADTAAAPEVSRLRSATDSALSPPHSTEDVRQHALRVMQQSSGNNVRGRSSPLRARGSSIGGTRAAAAVPELRTAVAVAAAAAASAEPPAVPRLCSQITPHRYHNAEPVAYTDAAAAMPERSPRAQQLGAELLANHSLRTSAALELTEGASPTTSQQSPHALFEHFVVCGRANGSPDRAVPALWFSAPEMQPQHAAMAAQLGEFCFPAGLETAAAPAQLPSARHIEDAMHSFVFTLSTSNGAERLYCTCVLHDERASDVPACIDHTTAKCLIGGGAIASQSGTRHNAPTQRAYCIVSRYPFYSLFFSLLYELVAIEHTRSTLSRRVAERQTLRKRARAFVGMLVALQAWQRVYGGTSICVQSNTSCLRDDILFRVPRQSEGGARILLVSQCVPTLLRLVRVECVLDALAALLLSQSVLVVGRHAGTVSACATALLTLLHPLCWQYVFVPLLPVAYSDGLYAPTPFLIGTVYTHDSGDTGACERLAQLYDCCTLDVDTRVLALPQRLKATAAAMPALPQRQLLAAQLARHCDRLYAPPDSRATVELLRHPFSGWALPHRRAQHHQTPDSHTSIVYCVLEELAQYMLWCILSIRRQIHGGTDGCVGCYASPEQIGDAQHQRALLARFSAAHQPFVRELLLSQHYQWMAEQFRRDDVLDAGVEGLYAQCKL